MELTFQTTGPKATMKIAADLARALKPPVIVALEGDLGAGKTTFAKGFIAALPGGKEIRVLSPTFALARSYQTHPPVHHLDLYRLSDDAAIEDLGLEELLLDPSAFVLLEWPRKHHHLPIDRTIWVQFSDDGGLKRQLQLKIPKANLSFDKQNFAAIFASP